ncbi:kinase-like domain-containing protein [Trichoderma novae-zelandiae]
MLFALIQSSRTPSFDFHLPYLHRALEENSSGTSSDKPNCQIVYNPTNDNCSLVHSAIGKQGTVISLGLTNTGTRCAGMLLDAEEPCIISPGIWTVSATIFESGRVKKVDLFDLLVLPRKFSVAIYAGSAASSKREAPAVIGRSAKRQRRRMESILPPSDKVVEVSLMQSASDANKRSPTPTPCDIIIGATISILDLKAGDTFFISTSVEGEEEAYQLQRTYDIMTTAAVSVFICQSPMRFEGEDVMAKVFRHNPDGSDLLEVANMWRQEKETLEQLVDHKNIVKLLGFDARQHVLYFKCLPASLGRGLISPFGPTHALTILRDISSALAHLADAKMLHNDIRPANIAYSRSQGAVLFNFAFASASGIESRYGTCWYLPPEFYDHKPRDSAADIWALGVTMLYALGKTQLPDYGVAWNHFEEQTATDGGDDKMEKWMDRVADCRSKLNKDDTVESLVFQMLDRDPAERTKAAAIELALKEAELT